MASNADAMRNPFQAKHIIDTCSMFIEDLAM